MANTIQLRRSATANAVPTTTQLALGELAINTFDGKLYLKKSNGTESIVEITNNQSLNTTSSPTFSKIILSTNGSGDNIAIGDDSYLGDVNQANTLRVMGQQDPTKGYIVFGNADNATALGRSGTGALTWGANTVYHSGNLPAGSATKITGMSLATTAEDNLVYGQMADNDFFRIRIGGTASNAGWAEIATADDGTEPIYVRQYSGVFTTVTRTATLLDASGDTSFPGTVTAGVDLVSNFSSGDEGGQIRLNKATTNTTLTTGISIDVYQNKLRIYETGGTTRGASIDLSAAATTVGSKLVITNGTTSNDSAIARYDGTTGSLIKNSTVYITDSGYLGINNPSPINDLDILGDSMRLLRSASYPPVLYLQRARASLGNTLATDYVGSIFFSGTYSGSQAYTAYISSQAEANSIATGTQGNLQFYTSSAGAYPTEKLRISAVGDILTYGNNLVNPNLKSYTEHKVTNATTTGTVTLDLSTSNVFQNTLTGNTTFAFSNPPANTKVFSFTIITVQDATGGRTITWPTSKKFSGGSTPPPTTAANAVDVWSVMTYDGGTSYIISLSVKDAK